MPRMRLVEAAGAGEIKPSAEIDAQCLARINKIVRLIQELFSALDGHSIEGALHKTLHNEIERISSKAQKKKQARASELSQQKLNFSASARPPTPKPNLENNDGRPEMGADLQQPQRWQVANRWQAANILREQFPGLDASTIASAIWEVFRDGRETCSHSELVAILEQKAKRRRNEP